MTDGLWPSGADHALAPEYVVPAVIYLCSEDGPTGHIIEVRPLRLSRSRPSRDRAALNGILVPRTAAKALCPSELKSWPMPSPANSLGSQRPDQSGSFANASIRDGDDTCACADPAPFASSAAAVLGPQATAEDVAARYQEIADLSGARTFDAGSELCTIILDAVSEPSR